MSARAVLLAFALSACALEPASKIESSSLRLMPDGYVEGEVILRSVVDVTLDATPAHLVCEATVGDLVVGRFDAYTPIRPRSAEEVEVLFKPTRRPQAINCRTEP
jgi:hypothetical protein